MPGVFGHDLVQEPGAGDGVLHTRRGDQHDGALRRHRTLVNCAFSFCRDQWFAPPGPLDATAPDPCPDEGPERGPSHTPLAPTALLAQGLTGHPCLAHPHRHPQPVVASLDGYGPALRAPGPDRRGQHRTRH